MPIIGESSNPSVYPTPILYHFVPIHDRSTNIMWTIPHWNGEQAYCRGLTEVSRRRTIKKIQAAIFLHSHCQSPTIYQPNVNPGPICQSRTNLSPIHDQSSNRRPMEYQSLMNSHNPMPIFNQLNPPIRCPSCTNSVTIC